MHDRYLLKLEGVVVLLSLEFSWSNNFKGDYIVLTNKNALTTQNRLHWIKIELDQKLL